MNGASITQNAFERFNINSISPTMLSQWDQAPATLILKRVFGVRSKANANMWRGDAVEAGALQYLHQRERLDRGAALSVAQKLAVNTFWDRADGEISEENEAASQLVKPMVEQAAIALDELFKDDKLMGTQLVAEGWLDDVDAPLFGKIDFVFESGRIVELKSTTRCPSSIEGCTPSHIWQSAFYSKARANPTTLLYVTAKKYNHFEIENDKDSLAMMRRIGLSIQAALSHAPDAVSLLKSLPLNVASFYWDEGGMDAYDSAVDGRLRPLAGPGTQDLAAQGFVTFGKHAGKHISEIPEKYCDWLLNPKLSDGGFFDVPEGLQDAIRYGRGS